LITERNYLCLMRKWIRAAITAAADKDDKAIAMLKSYDTKLAYLTNARLISKVQACLNLIFQPLDWFGWISRSSPGAISAETTSLLDRTACTCWLLVETLELLQTLFAYRHNRWLEKHEKKRRDPSRTRVLFWNIIVRLINMTMAYNWTRKEGILSNFSIGVLGVASPILDSIANECGEPEPEKQKED